MTAARDYLDALVDFAADTRLEDIPRAALEHLRLVFADTLAVIAAGMRTREMRALVESHASLAADGKACVLGTGQRLNPLDAAALNATAGVSLELDAGNSRSHGHPAIHCLPSALAIAQQRGASGAHALLAYAVGYEICGRVGAAAKMHIMVQPHGTYGVLGAAITVAKLEQVPKERLRELINIAAATPMGGNRQTMLEGATVRNWYAGHSHAMGQMAVRLARAGFTAPREALNVTFGQVLGESFDTDILVKDLGRQWLAADGYIKLYPGARHLHSAIDAVRDALAKHARPFDADDIVRIDARTHRLAAFCGEKNVRGTFGALFSVPFAIATVLYHQRWDVASFSEEAVANTHIRDLMQRIDLSEEPRFTAAYPQRQICELRMMMRDGTVLEGRCEIMRGEPGNPHDPSEVRAKYFALATPIWGAALAERVYEESVNLERVADMRGFARGADL